MVMSSVSSVNVEVLVKGDHLVERQYGINIVMMCDFHMLCKHRIP